MSDVLFLEHGFTDGRQYMQSGSRNRREDVSRRQHLCLRGQTASMLVGCSCSCGCWLTGRHRSVAACGASPAAGRRRLMRCTSAAWAVCVARARASSSSYLHAAGCGRLPVGLAIQDGASSHLYLRPSDRTSVPPILADRPRAYRAWPLAAAAAPASEAAAAAAVDDKRLHGCSCVVRLRIAVDRVSDRTDV